MGFCSYQKYYAGVGRVKKSPGGEAVRRGRGRGWLGCREVGVVKRASRRNLRRCPGHC